MHILSQLSIIDAQQFGEKCFKLFNEILKSGEGINQMAIQILSRNVTPHINSKLLTRIPRYMVQGMTESVQILASTKMLKQLNSEFVKNWVVEICARNENFSSMISEEDKSMDLQIVK